MRERRARLRRLPLREVRDLSLPDLQLSGVSAVRALRGGSTARLTVRAAIAPLHAEPSPATPLVSQRVAGQTLDTLEDDAQDEASGKAWLHVAGDDAYPGWVHRGYLTAGSRPVEATALVSLGCVVARGGDSIHGHRALPLRALLAPGDSCVAGRTVAFGELPRRFPLDARAIVHSAQELFAGASYMWGGVTPWGADCSGFVQTVFALHGIPLPRDAWQQAGVGSDAGCDPAAAEPGDLLFFSEAADGRITHVGIGLGDASLVHVALGRGGHAVDRLTATRDPYVNRLREFFRFARRVL